MAGLVLELQADALNRDVSVSDLLRKALVVSRKLAVTQFEDWIQKELKGYSPGDEIPSYREIQGQVKAWNPYHGWQPINFGDHEMAEVLSKLKITQPVGELDSLGADRGEGPLQVPFPQKTINALMKAMNVPLQPILHVAPSEVVGILDAIRNIILDWALKLEQEGVIGEGMSFSQQERQTAKQITYQVTTNIGSMQNSQFQQCSPGASQKLEIENDLPALVQILQRLKAFTKDLSLASTDEQELLAEIATVEMQANSPRPKASIVLEALRSIRTILEGAAGNVLASGILVELAKFFA